MRNLYFIAIVPPHDVAQTLDMVRHQIWQQFGPSHALNSPPHITLIPPFKMEESSRASLKQQINKVTLALNTFPLKAEGISAFEQHTLFLKVHLSPELASLQQNVKKLVTEQLQIKPDRPERDYHPHFTLAFKDLKKTHFQTVLTFLQAKNLHFNFQVSQICLLRHSGKRWLLDYRSKKFNSI